MLTRGFNHVAIVTEDLERCVEFYVDLLEAEATTFVEGGLRHALVRVGPSSLLHLFELGDGMAAPAKDLPMFNRGRIDHLALDVADEATFNHVRARIVNRGAGDGLVTDFGLILSTGFTDPDGFDAEVCYYRPHVPADLVRPLPDALAAGSDYADHHLLAGVPT